MPAYSCCQTCGAALPMPKGRGRPRAYCSDDCQRFAAVVGEARRLASRIIAASPSAVTARAKNRIRSEFKDLVLDLAEE